MEKNESTEIKFDLSDWEYFRKGSDNIVFKNKNPLSLNYKKVLIIPMET